MFELFSTIELEFEFSYSVIHFSQQAFVGPDSLVITVGASRILPDALKISLESILASCPEMIALYDEEFLCYFWNYC